MTSHVKVLFNATTIYDEKSKIWRGEKIPHKYGPDVTIGKAVLEAYNKDPDHVAQICYHNNKQYTNKELAIYTIRIAQHLQQMNLQQGDVVGLCAANSDFIAPLVYGCVANGLIVSTLDVSFDKAGIKHIFSITKPKIIFCDGNLYNKIKEVFPELQLTDRIYTVKDHIKGVPFTIDKFLEETGKENQFILPKLQNGANQIAFILCSSGTTGLPKGVCMSHTMLLNRGFFRLNGEQKNVTLCFSTLYWLSGLIWLINGTLDKSTRIISDKAFDAEDFFNIVKRYKVNVVFTPPSQIGLSLMSPKLKDADLSSIEYYLSGGSAVPYSLVEKFKKYAKNATFITGYGMSETAGAVALEYMENGGSVGKLAENIEIKIVNENNELLGPNEKGELVLRTPFHWAGYYNNPQATAAIYDADGWIYSGDIGYIDTKGVLHVVDRKKDIYKYNNFHFYPTEIENVIMEMPDVMDACVCAIPDIISTHLPAAAIVKLPNSSLTEKEVYDYVADRCEHFQRLRGGVYFFDCLPKTPSGKNLRKQITELCISQHNKNMNNNSPLSN